MATDKPMAVSLPARPTTVSWPAGKEKGSPTLHGHEHMAKGKKVKVVVHGKVSGFRDDEYGGGIDLKAHKIHLEPDTESGPGEPDADDEAPSMAEQIKGKRDSKKK